MSTAKWRLFWPGLNMLNEIWKKVKKYFPYKRSIALPSAQCYTFFLWANELETMSLQQCHNGRDGVSNHQRLYCLLNPVCSKKTSKLRATGFCEWNSPLTGEFPSQRPVTRKMFPFDDVIMVYFQPYRVGGTCGSVQGGITYCAVDGHFYMNSFEGCESMTTGD